MEDSDVDEINGEEIAHRLTGTFRSKLKQLSSSRNEDSYKEELTALQAYVSELSEQNDILVQTIEDLEKDSNDRVVSLENKLINSSEILKEQSNKCENLQKKIDLLEMEKINVDSHFKALEEESITMGEEHLQYQAHINSLEHDVDQLIHVIKKARISGKWELSKMDLKVIPLENILDTNTIVDPIPRNTLEEATENHVDELKAQLKARDETITRLERELKKKTEQYHNALNEMSHTGEMVDSVRSDVNNLERQQHLSTTTIAQKDVTIQRLKNKLQQHEQMQRELADENNKQHEEIMALKQEVNSLESTISMRILELDNKTQSIQILERQLLDMKEKSLLDSLRDDDNEDMKLQLQEARNKIGDQQHHINELKIAIREKENNLNNSYGKQQTMRDQTEMIRALQQQIKVSNESFNKQKIKLDEITYELEEHKRKISKMKLESSSQYTDVENNLRKEVERKERDIKLLENQIKRIEEQKTDNESKVDLRDKAIDRLQNQQKQYMEEVTRRDSALHSSELKLLKIEDEKRRVTTELERLTKKHEVVLQDYKTLKDQYNNLATEKGKIDAKLKAYQISNESEQSALTTEVNRREELIQKLRHENMKLEDEKQQAKDSATITQSNLEDIETQNTELLEKLATKEKIIVDREMVLAEMKTKMEECKLQLERFEDEKRDIILKLNAAERAREIQAHQCAITKEHADELTSEVEHLQAENQVLLQKLNSKTNVSDGMANELNDLKRSILDKDRKVSEQQELLKHLERRATSSAAELAELKRETSAEFASRDHKILMLEEEIALSQQRYSDVYEDLTNTEVQLETANKKFREMFDIKSDLEQKLQNMIGDVEQLEMSLSLTAEKHKTAIQQNAEKDGLILNLQSELDATQQEFEGAVEEIAQRTEENEQLVADLEILKQRHQALQESSDQSAQKIEEYVDQINLLQTANADQKTELLKTVTRLSDLKEEMTLSSDTFQKELDDLTSKVTNLKNDLKDREEDIDDRKLQIASLSEKNAELMAQINVEGDQRQHAVSKLNELQEQYEDLKAANETTIREQSEKIVQLESESHTAILRISKLDGSLKLAEEKLKNSETQLFDLERHANALETQIEELKDQLSQEQQSTMSTTQNIENLEEINQTQSNQLHQQTMKMNSLTTDLKIANDLLSESKLRNTRCEEIIREMREKLSKKLKDGEQQGKLLNEQESQIKNLQQIIEVTKEQMNEVTNSLSSSEKTVLVLREKLAERTNKLDELESENSDLNSTLTIIREERDRLKDKTTMLEEKFERLRTSLEKDNLDLLEENCSLKQKNQDLEDSVSTLEEINKAKTSENNHLDRMVSSLKEDVDKKEQELEQKRDELFSGEETVNELHEQCQVLLEEKKSLINETSKQLREIGDLRGDLTELRQQYKESTQQLAHYQEKSKLSDRNLAATQEELSTRIAEIVKLEKLVRKLQTDLNKSVEDKKTKEISLGQYKKLLEQNTADLKMTKNKYQQLAEENKAHKAALVSYESQLNDAHSQTEQLSIEIESKENSIKDFQNMLDDLQRKLRVADDQVGILSKDLEDHQNKICSLSECESELITKLHDKENSNSHLRKELESCIQKNKNCLEKMASKDAEIRVLKADLHSQQKKCSHQDKYIKRNSEQIEKYQKEVQSLQESSQDAVASLSIHEANTEKLQLELTQNQAKLDECMEQLSIKSKDLANTRTELTTVQQHHNQSEKQQAFIDSKNKRLKTELKKALERNKTSANEMAQLVQNVSELKIQLQTNIDERGKANDEISKRDQQIIALKVDLAASEERLKMLDEENDRLKNDGLHISQQHHRTMEQLHRTQQEMVNVKKNGDRLARESEIAVENMNNWVKEQRHDNEKISSKFSLQKERIDDLERNNRSLNDENERLRQQNSGLRKSIDERKQDKERIEKQRINAAELQMHVRELQATIQKLEENAQKERNEKCDTVSDYQERIKSNVDTIQQLHKQLSELNKENLRQRTLLERQSASRKNLQAQLKSKDNDFELLNKSYTELEASVQGINSRNTRQDDVSSLLARELEKADGSELKDKAYWRNRVGELSKLRHNEDYWSKRVHQFDNSKTNDSESDF